MDEVGEFSGCFVLEGVRSGVEALMEGAEV